MNDNRPDSTLRDARLLYVSIDSEPGPYGGRIESIDDWRGQCQELHEDQYGFEWQCTNEIGHEGGHGAVNREGKPTLTWD